jgi:hypothetical protein
MQDAQGNIAATPDVAAEMRFEPLEPTPEVMTEGLTLWGAPFLNVTSTLRDALREIYALPWYTWTPTVGVSEISLSTEPNPGASPPENVWARVSIYGFGFEPGVAVTTKWNNAFGFADNGVGPNSIQLQSPVPDSGGRFAFQVLHKAVPRQAKDWYWEGNNQLVLVAQQPMTGGIRQASQRYIPPHVLWQWVP